MGIIDRLQHLTEQERALNCLFVFRTKVFTRIRSFICAKLLGANGQGLVCRGLPSVVGGKRMTLGDAVAMGRRVKLYCNPKGKIKIGNGVFVGSEVNIRNPGDLINIDDATTICDYSVIKSSPDGGTVRIGKRVWIGQNCIIEGKSISIGNDVILAPYIHVIDGDHGIARNRQINKQAAKTAPVIIEDDVWIGNGSVILKGVKLSQGCVISARSMVTHDIPPYAIAVGVPARIIGERK